MALPGQNDLAYGSGVNFNLLAFMGALDGIVVDVGCGAGEWAEELRAAGAKHLRGLEPTEGAQAARARYDEVFEGTLEQAPPGFFSGASLVVFADVLEHLVDPWSALSLVRQAVPKGCQLAISLPNVQNWRLLSSILVRGRFDYSDAGGILDRGHLRWFTATSLAETVEAAGWSVSKRDGYALGRISNFAMASTRGRAGSWVYHQLHLMAVAR